MTRINCGIPTKELIREHLLAEHREIKRIPNCIKKGKYNLKNVPKQFKLGTGHVSFFYDKLLYLKKRYEALYKECIERGYDVTYYGEAFDNIKDDLHLSFLWNDYEPTDNDRYIVRERIQERIQESILKKEKKKNNS